MENVFNINYRQEVDRLGIEGGRKENKILKFLKKHKFISITFASFFVLSIVNFYLIFSFMKVLENI